MTTTISAEPSRSRDPLGTRRPSVLAIVVTHNGRTWFKDCLVSLNTQSYDLLDVLIVDDASRDSRVKPSLKRLAKRHLRGRRWGFLRTPRPLGFGGAINWALGRVRTDADLLLFLHDDVALDPSSVALMVNRMVSDGQTAIVGPKIVSWEDPDVLEEVGMAADRFGYPYKGLEEGEIDLGQHDQPSDVFYVTSTCLLIKHEVFKQLRGWDSRMRAFSEDLDLCWRARIAGHNVRVEPGARARHAIALASGQRLSPFSPTRYFIRRNRLRTVLKNSSGPRLIWLVPQFVLLAMAEMIGFVVLRQPREILQLMRALLWNVLTFPQTLTERSRVQGYRKVTDRTLMRLQVREATRVRSYIGHQAERLEEAWGRRTEVLARRGVQIRSLAARLRGPAGLVVLAVLFGVVIGFRHLLWGPSVAIGELLPFPERATALWRALGSPWHPTGLGYAGSAPPAFALLGIFPLLTFGAAGVAQKLLVLSLGVVALFGAYRLVAGFVDRTGRWAAGLAYALGGVGFASLRGGHLGALVFGAAAPFALLLILRLQGWARPPAWHRGRALAGLVVAAAVSAAFVPGSLLLYALAAAVLTGIRSASELGERARRDLSSCLVGLVAAWALLLPWSWHWFGGDGPLGQLFAAETRPVFADSFRGHGFTSVLLGQTPDVPALFGLALPLLGLLALLIASGPRRRAALGLWGVVLSGALVVSAVASGLLPPLVASPTEAGVIPAIAFAGLAGLAVGAFRVDLPQRGLGWVHAVTIGALGAAGFLAAAGVLPAFWRGEWAPGRTMGGPDARVTATVSSLLESQAAGGAFRALWVGEGWSGSIPGSARPLRAAFLTGSRGPLLTDLFPRRGPAERNLERVIASIEEEVTDRGGALLGAFDIRYVVLDQAHDVDPWLAQRDLGLIRSDPTHYVLQNTSVLPRAGIYGSLPSSVVAVAESDPSLMSTEAASPLIVLEQESATGYIAQEARGPGELFLAESSDPGWHAAIGEADLDRAEGGWGNAFEVSGSLSGTITVEYPRSFARLLVLLLQILAWATVLGAAFSRRRRRPSLW